MLCGDVIEMLVDIGEGKEGEMKKKYKKGYLIGWIKYKKIVDESPKQNWE